MPPTDTTSEPAAAPRELRPRPSRAEIDPAALDIMHRHRDEVLASARRWAETPEDAEDAFQRGLEIMLTKAPSTDPDHLVPWLKTVVKREAWSVRRQRERHTPPASEFEDLDTPGCTTAHDEAVTFERLQHGAEALRGLKPHEVRAFVLKAEGLSYREICDTTGWTYTKVNRLLTEGRRRFQDQLSGIESGAECERLAPLLSLLADGEARAEDMALLRPHLRTCLMCRARLRDYRAAPARVAAAAPPVVLGGSLVTVARDLLSNAGVWISERSAAIGVRWHQAAELATAHKAAAVVASAAVVGGGGAATMATGGGHPQGAAPRPPVVAAPAPAAPFATSAIGTQTAPAASDTAPSGDRRREGRERDKPVEAHAEAPTPAAPPSAETQAPADHGGSGEFTPDAAPPAGPAAPRGASPAPAAPPRPAPSQGSGGGEFSP